MRPRILFPLLPRHPVLRVLALVTVAALLIGLLTLGFVIGAIVLVVAALIVAVKRWRARGHRGPRDADVIEGEFTVVTPSSHASLPRTE